MKKTYVYLAAIALSTLVQGCTNQAEPLQSTAGAVEKSVTGITITGEQRQKIGLVSAPVEQRTVVNSVSANGLLDVPTQYMASVTTYLGAYVKLADKHVGERVTKGQLLAVMEGPAFVDLQQQYLEQKSKVALLSAELERQRNLASDSITSQKQLQQTTAAYEQALSAAAALKQKLGFLHVNIDALERGTIASSFTIIAPITGYLTSVTAKIGSFISPGESLMEIVDLSHLHVELNVYETDALAVREGQKMEVTLPSLPGRVLEADIYLIDKEFDETTRAVKVHGHFEEDDVPFIVGMYVEGRIITGEATGYAVPAIAAVFSDNNRFVFLEKALGDKSEYLAVDVTGVSETGEWILLPESAIKPGFDKVVTRGAGYVLAAWTMEE